MVPALATTGSLGRWSRSARNIKSLVLWASLARLPAVQTRPASFYAQAQASQRYVRNTLCVKIHRAAGNMGPVTTVTARCSCIRYDRAV